MKAPQKKKASKSHPNAFGKQKHGGPPRPSNRSSTDNPFDKIANARKKHDVLNRRVKGEDRNVGRARSKAVEDRKSRLMADYTSNKKSTSFADKRFGENDATLSLEDKMFLRFQKEKIKKVRNKSVFNLDSGEADVLTHKGAVLSEGNAKDQSGWSSDEDDKDHGLLDREVVDKLHFGGGLLTAVDRNTGLGRSSEPTTERISRADALQEIIAKSKVQKAQKKEAKEEQETERERLDREFADLVKGSSVEFRPMKRDRSEDIDPSDDVDDYDRSLREMAFEARVQATDRTKTPEEAALEAKERLEELEAARIRRMKANLNGSGASAGADGDGGAGADDEAEEVARALRINRGNSKESAKGKASGKWRNDDEMDEDDEAEESDEDDEDDEDGEDDDEEGEEDEEDEEDDEEASEEFEVDDYDAVDAGEEVHDVEVDEEDEEGEDNDEDEDEDENEEEEEEDGDDDGGDDSGSESEPPAAITSTKQPSVKSAPASAPIAADSSNNGVNPYMPHKLVCPADIEGFTALVAKFVRSPIDLKALVDRILVWNSVKLPGAEGSANKSVMHNFMDVLLKFFVATGDALATAVSGDDNLDTSAPVTVGNKKRNRKSAATVMDELDYLTVVIFKLSQDIPETIPALWGRTLKIVESQLQKRLRDYVQGVRTSCWFSLGRLLLFQLLGHVFAVTDFRHSVVGPASLLLCQSLVQCPVTSAKDVASGLLTVSVLLEYHRETARWVPETLAFVNSVLSLYVSPLAATASSSASVRNTLKTISIQPLAWLRPAAARWAHIGDASSVTVPWSAFFDSSSNGDSNSNSNSNSNSAVAASLLLTAYRIIETITEQHAGSDALPELLGPTVELLRQLRPQDGPAVLPVAIQERHVSLLAALMEQRTQKIKSRAPLRWRNPVKTAIESKNPRFEMDYSYKKDLEPDEQRSQLKSLNRQFKREKRAALRELRRDSSFLDQVQFKERQEAQQGRQEERWNNFKWLEQQQAAVSTHVKKNKGELKGGGSGGNKKRSSKRR